MNLKSMTDLQLDASAAAAAKNERSALIAVLRSLAEVDRRKSFSPRYENIHAYTVGFLGYDSKSAWRRVNAMRLMKELPEIAPSIETGRLDLTKLVIAQNHFRVEAKMAKKEIALGSTPTTSSIEDEIGSSFFSSENNVPRRKLSRDGKIEILRTVAEQTSREAIRDLTSKSSSPERLKKPDLVKPLPDQVNEVRLILSDDDLAAIREIKSLLAHKIPNATIGDVVGVALKKVLASIKKEKSGENQKRRAALAAELSKPKNTLSAVSRRRPGRRIQREVWERAGGVCELCRSSTALEYDHRIPFAHGGLTTVENLRLLCRNCNQREAIKIFGLPISTRRLRFNLPKESQDS